MHESDREVRKGVVREVLAILKDSPRTPRAELPAAVPVAAGEDGLGDPMGIDEVARLIGCSVWTVRQRCLREGLPYFRASRTGRFIFYRNQVIGWLIHKQTERR